MTDSQKDQLTNIDSYATDDYQQALEEGKNGMRPYCDVREAQLNGRELTPAIARYEIARAFASGCAYGFAEAKDAMNQALSPAQSGILQAKKGEGERIVEIPN
jgi:hypothetical protein